VRRQSLSRVLYIIGFLALCSGAVSGAFLTPIRVIAYCLVVGGCGWRIISSHTEFPVIERCVIVTGVGIALAVVSIYFSWLLATVLPNPGISTIPLLLAWALVIAVTELISVYGSVKRNKQIGSRSRGMNIQSNEVSWRVALIAFSAVLCTVCGAFLRNEFGILSVNYVSVILIITLIAILLVNDWSRNTMVLGIFAVSLSLLWSQHLMTSYVYGADIRISYYFVSQILTNGVWNPAQGSQLQLTVMTAVPASITTLTRLDPHWVFKILYSTVFAVTPVAIYLSTLKTDRSPLE